MTTPARQIAATNDALHVSTRSRTDYSTRAQTNDDQHTSGVVGRCVVSIAVALLVAAPAAAFAQPAGFNYDESKVPEFSLPDPLVTLAGHNVTDAATWQRVRRQEILELFRTWVYGRSPAGPDQISFEQFSEKTVAVNGKAIRREITIRLTDKPDGPAMDLLIYTPTAAKGPVPVFLGLNFGGNHTVDPDPAIRLSTRWMRNDARRGITDHRADEKTRGASAGRWAIEAIIDRGYGLATIYYGDIDPDFDDGFANGVHPHFLRPDQTRPDDDEWGSIAAWSWGLSRALDYFEQDDRVDQSRVAVMGHSRLGKTSLWAGAEDQRFAMVISNDSGCGGAALSRRRFGETVERINTSFPHWFNSNFKRFNSHEDDLPVDQHMLIALMAPRPVYVASAVEDQWADPRGEFLSAQYASPVYKLLTGEPIAANDQPEADHPVTGNIGYHVRTGGHDVTDYDWQQYLNFADQHFQTHDTAR